MNYKTALALVIGLLIFASPTLAQLDTAATVTPAPEPKKPHRFEIIPMGGYVWTIAKSATYSGAGGDIDIKDSEFYGIAFDINMAPGVQARLLYRRQNTELQFKRAGTADNLGSMGVEYWHVGVVKAVKMQEKVMPFTSFTLGGTRYDADGGDDWKFSVILGLGAKVYLNERLGLMFTGQMPFSFTNTFVGIGTGGVSLGGSGIAQFDVAAGLMISI